MRRHIKRAIRPNVFPLALFAPARWVTIRGGWSIQIFGKKKARANKLEPLPF